MRIKTGLGLAIILTLAVVVAREYKNAPGRSAGFRDAPAGEQLKDAVSTEGGTAAEIGAPQPVEFVTGSSLGARELAAQSPSGPGVTRFYSENDPWHKRLAQAIGVDYPCTVETKMLGTPINNVTKLTFIDGRRQESVVVKGYDTLVTNAKFWPMKLLIPGTPIITNALGRLKNDVMMNEKLRNAGFKTHQIVLTDPENRITVTKFLPKMESMDKYMQSALKGDADALLLIERLGSSYGALHRNNFTLGDSRAGNIMLVNGEFYFTDLEQATVGGNKEWDLAEFFYFSLTADKAVGTVPEWALVTRKFLQGYKAGGGDVSSIKGAMHRRYLGIFCLAMPSLSTVHAIRLEMKKAAGADQSAALDE